MDYGWQTIKNACPSKSNCYKIITIGGHSSLAKTKSLKDYENALSLAQKKLRTIKDDDKNKIRLKLNQFLLGRGFKYDIISKVINELIKDEY